MSSASKSEKYPSGLNMSPKSGKSVPHASHGHKHLNPKKKGCC